MVQKYVKKKKKEQWWGVKKKDIKYDQKGPKKKKSGENINDQTKNLNTRDGEKKKSNV